MRFGCLMIITTSPLWKINVRKMLSKMSGKCHVRPENVWKISHASEKCPEYCNIPDRQISGKRPEYCNIPDIFWTQTISGHLFFIGLEVPVVHQIHNATLIHKFFYEYS